MNSEEQWSHSISSNEKHSIIPAHSSKFSSMQLLISDKQRKTMHSKGYAFLGWDWGDHKFIVAVGIRPALSWELTY